ncbi:MAG: hypothetical protein EXR76_09660 [Myxococcales bacterium]|nr:hypothetical protein [Myxococcales bacterium]
MPTKAGLRAEAERARISALRMQLLDLHPFWGHLLLQLELVADEKLSHLAATDCVRRLWFNPSLTAELDEAQLGFVLVHEVGHLAYASKERSRGRERQLWNCATDYAINRVVAGIPHPVAGGRSLYRPPEGILLDRRFDGLTAEAIYDRLSSEPGQVMLLEGGIESVGDQETRGHGGGLDLHLPEDMSPADRERLDEYLRGAAAHWEAEGRRGSYPADAMRAFDDRTSRTPWRRLLHAFVSEALSTDELDPRRPNRRWLTEDIFRPGRGGERVGCVVVAIDSSGSMSRELVSAACGELRAITEQAAEAHIIVADAAVQETLTLDELEKWLSLRRLRGGGGTDHRPVFDWIKQKRMRPDVFVGVTDLVTAFPTKRPPFPVLWLTPPKHPEPPFGRVVVMGAR